MTRIATNRKYSRRGVTLVEVAISTLLVGLVLVSAMNGVGAVVQSRTATIDREVGPALARGLMGEILYAHYTDVDTPNGPLGPETGESGSNRSAFDDVDDYHGVFESAPTKKDGSSLNYGSGWQRSVSVSFVVPNTMTVSASDTGLKLITVTASNPTTGASTTLKALRTGLGQVERLPSFERTFVTGAQVTIKTSNSSVDVASGASIKNHALDQ